MRYKKYNEDIHEDREYLRGFLDSLVEKNETDAYMIRRLEEHYDPSCWFSVISFAEDYIYGVKD